MNLAIIGCSGMGVQHGLMASGAGLSVVACVDTNSKAARSLAKQHGAKAYSKASDVLGREDVDAVCIATPTPTHKDLVVASAKAGKHIFCEKPFTRTEQQAGQALRAVEKTGVKLFVGHVVRYFQEFEAMKAQVESGKIGRTGFVRMYRGGICPVGSGNWFRDFEQSGGVVLDTSIHDFDWLRYVFGEVDRVYAQRAPRTTPAPMDYAMTTLHFRNDLLAHVIGTWAHPQGFRVKVEICGDGGMVQFDSDEAPLNMHSREQAGKGPGMIIPGSPVDVSPYQLEWEDFARWLEADIEPRVSPEDAVQAIRIANAALKSAESGRPVTL